MNSGESLYIWQADDWPRWRYDSAALVGALTQVSHAQGLLLGRLTDVGMALRDQTSLAALTDDVLKTSAIEGEALDCPIERRAPARLARRPVPHRLQRLEPHPSRRMA